MNVADLQRALIRHGFNPGRVDGLMGGNTTRAIRAFQAARGLAQTGMPNPSTAAALSLPAPQPEAPVVKAPATHIAAEVETPSLLVVPAEWMPPARMERIICHWSGGAHKASGLDRTHYHIIIEGDGHLVRGMWPISANGIGKAGKRASHTLNLNTGSIGVSLACMAEAKERPFNAGIFPMTPVQWATLPLVVADLCRRYAIPVTGRTVLSHAEVQPTLGIQQRRKWDFTWRAGMAAPGDPVKIGDELRHAVFNLMR